MNEVNGCNKFPRFVDWSDNQKNFTHFSSSKAYLNHINHIIPRYTPNRFFYK